MALSTAVRTAANASFDPTPTALSEVVRALDAMVASAEPAVVFTSAVRLCVPLICDIATVTMTGPEQQAYAITWPRNTTDQAPTTTVRALITGQPTGEHPGYRGTLTLHFRSLPTEERAVLAQLVVDRATALVHRERLAAAS
jgi:hypothetical protein